MFKKPKKNDVAMVAKGFAAFTGGRMLSRAASSIIPNTMLNSTMSRGLVGVASILAAAAYKGPNKEIVVPAFVGAASEQLGSLIDREVRKVIPSSAHPAIRAISGTPALAALNCPGSYPALSQPFSIDASPGGYVQLPESTQDFAGA